MQESVQRSDLFPASGLCRCSWSIWSVTTTGVHPQQGDPICCGGELLMNSSYRNRPAMLPVFTLKGPLPQGSTEIDAITNTINTTKQCWQVDKSCSETTHRPTVSKHHLSLVNVPCSVCQGSGALEINCN